MNTGSQWQLLRALREWNNAYRRGEAKVSDAIYDSCEAILRAELERVVGQELWADAAREFLSAVGAPPVSAWAKIHHKVPMGSLNKAKTPEEVAAWVKRFVVGEPQLCVSDKLDGLSVGLHYEDGRLVSAATRGDGETGENISRNVRKMKGVAHYIPDFTGFVRGEIVLLHADWKTHFPEMANPRNGAAGLAKRLDGDGAEHLTVMAYLVQGPSLSFPTKAHEFEFLRKYFKVPQVAVLPLPALADFYVAAEGRRAHLGYDVDGLVVEFNDSNLRQAFHAYPRPNGSIALKYAAQEGVTTLQSILWSVGNTGRITPIAQLAPVEVAGATIRQASLHNLSKMSEVSSEWRAGAQVLVSRRNDVIPYVEQVVFGGEGDLLMYPDACPACGGKIEFDGEYLVCPSESCTARTLGALKVWCTKLDLKGWGDGILQALHDTGRVQQIPDLYTLTVDELAALDVGGSRLGMSTAKKLLQTRDGKRDLPLHILVGSLNIPLVSRSTMQTIVQAGLDTLETLRAASVADLQQVEGIGPERAASLVEGLKARAQVLDRLLLHVRVQGALKGPLSGRTYCMTGFRDASMASAVESLGGTWKSSVGRDLTALIAKDPATDSGKVGKARQLGVTVFGREYFATYLEETRARG